MDDEARAFPFVSHGGVHEHQFFSAGMTLRDYFAAKAMQAQFTIGLHPQESYAFLAEQAYSIADAMIQERVK